MTELSVGSPQVTEGPELSHCTSVRSSFEFHEPCLIASAKRFAGSRFGFTRPDNVDLASDPARHVSLAARNEQVV